VSARKQSTPRRSYEPLSEVRATTPSDLYIALTAMGGPAVREDDAQQVLSCAIELAVAEAKRLASDLDGEGDRFLLASALGGRLEALQMLVGWRLDVAFKTGAS
jgi:hypothetical protein